MHAMKIIKIVRRVVHSCTYVYWLLAITASCNIHMHSALFTYACIKRNLHMHEESKGFSHVIVHRELIFF